MSTFLHRQTQERASSSEQSANRNNERYSTQVDSANSPSVVIRPSLSLLLWLTLVLALSLSVWNLFLFPHFHIPCHLFPSFCIFVCSNTRLVDKACRTHAPACSHTSNHVDVPLDSPLIFLLLKKSEKLEKKTLKAKNRLIADFFFSIKSLLQKSE